MCENKSRLFILPLLLLLTLLPWLTPPADAWGASRIAVLYPEVREPYLSVFSNIIRGIESQGERQILPYPLPENFDSVHIEKWLDARRPDAVIALGSRGFQMAEALKGKLPVVVGAVLLAPNGLPGISLAADPLILFATLKELVPGTRRVFVVYQPEESAWLVERARGAARAQGLELHARPAADLRAAVTTYRDLVEKSLGERDAVWLTMDSVSANDRAVLPMLLEAAWKKEFVLFSSKPGHAKQGVLFSQYPDNHRLGRQLGTLAEGIRAGHGADLTPSRELETAVNLRTAAHLGLNFRAEQKDRFHLTFP